MWRWPSRRRRIDDETRAEFEAHLALLTDRYVRAGMTPEDARVQARRQFGNVTWHREEIRSMNGIAWIDGLIQDLRYALRQVRRAPGFSAVVIATLALGIGGTTAVFSVLHAVLLAPLPYAEPGKLIRLYQQEPDRPDTRRAFSAPQFRMLRGEAASFDVGARYVREDLGLDIAHGGSPQRLRVLMVTSDYLRTLRAEPMLGPGFVIDDETGARRDDRRGAPRIVLSQALWRARFNADPSAIGTTIRLSAEPYEVAGVAPAGFQDPLAGDVDAWLPYALTSDTIAENNSLAVFGRLRPGVSLEQAASELALLSQSAKERWPEARASSIVAVSSLRNELVSTSQHLLQLLLLAVGLVLIVACVNVANLGLVRATGRLQEFAVRAALGSGRGRLARQLLVESFVLAGCGAVAGLVLAAIGVHVLQAIGGDALPRLESAGFDPVVLLFSVTITMATAVACGVMPALHLARSDPNRALMPQPRSATASRRHGALRNGLAAAQLALALALLAGAGVLSVSLYRLMRVDLGIRTEGVIAFDLNLPSIRYDAERRGAVQEELAHRFASIPGVTSAGATSRLPATGSFNTWPVVVETGPLAGTSVRSADQPEHRTVSGDFFRAFAIPVLAGRTFDERDDPSAPMRAVVSAHFARFAFPGVPLDGVVGQRIAVLGRKNTREIIGVVGDVAVDVYGTPSGAVYSAHRQFAGNRNWTLSHVVASGGSTEDTITAIRREVAALDPELVVHRPTLMTDIVGRGAGRQRFALILIAAFAVVALTLATVGLYGVLAYAVRQRTPELGIRMALGATAGEVRALVFRQAAGVLGVGLIAGVGGALLLGRWLSALVFQVSPWDARILGVMSLILIATSLVAAWLPARRAARIQPRTAMQDAS